MKLTSLLAITFLAVGCLSITWAERSPTEKARDAIAAGPRSPAVPIEEAV